MRRYSKIVFLAMFMFAALSLSAYADDKAEVSATVGEYGEYLLNEDYEIKYNFGTFFTTYPGGMWCELRDGELYLCGTPEKAGTYQFVELIRPTNTVPWDRFKRIYVTVEVIEEVKEIEITKHPTGEDNYEGGTEIFIAYADHADSMWWRLLSPDGNTAIEAAAAGNRFMGLAVEGAYYDTLYLENIPLSLDGWYAQAVFEGNGGPKYTEPALIRVHRLSAPVLYTQPKDTALQMGEETTLHVLARSSGSGENVYQWYESSSRSDLNGELLPGENTTDLVLDYSNGVRYFYCEVYTVNGLYRSDVVKSDCVSVTGLKPTFPPAPSPMPSEVSDAVPSEESTAAPAPENIGEESTPAAPAREVLYDNSPDAAEPATAAEEESRTDSKLLLSSVMLVGSAACLGAAIVLIIKQRKKAGK